MTEDEMFAYAMLAWCALMVGTLLTVAWHLAQGTSAFGQDAQRLEAKPAGPVAEGFRLAAERAAEANTLLHESLYHLRLDDGAKGYHDKVIAFRQLLKEPTSCSAKKNENAASVSADDAPVGVAQLTEGAEHAARWLDQMADRFEGEWPNTAQNCRRHVSTLLSAYRQSAERIARLRGHLASIVAAPDCCAVSKQIARVAIADDPAEPIREASFDRTCPTTFGREAVEHSWVTVTRSTTRPQPYRMCSKCGLTEAVELPGIMAHDPDIVCGDDGFYVFWPTSNRGAYAAHDLLRIAHELDRRNVRWAEHIQREFSGPHYTPTPELWRIAQRIVDSDPVTSTYASCEWDELGDDGKAWICAIVAQGMALSENSRSEVEAEGRQPGPATQDAPPNSDPADNHSHRTTRRVGKGVSDEGP